MRRLKLLNLTFIGEDRKPSYIRFGPGATVIFDSSGRGSSIFNAIDFALGRIGCNETPRWKGYSHVLLGLELLPGEYVTLARSIDNGASFVFDANILDSISEDCSPDFEQLVEQYHAEKEADIPRYLLERLELDDTYVQVEASGKCHPAQLRFDDLAFLCLMDAVDMQDPVTPGFGQRSDVSVRGSSVLRFVLTGEDESTMRKLLSSGQQELTHRAQQEIIDDMIAEVEKQLDGSFDPETLKHLHAQVDEEISGHRTNITLLLNEHKGLFAEYKNLQNQNDALSLEQAETITLYRRFNLLRDQYVNDLSRLAMVAEAHNMLTYLQDGSCHSCGSALDGQRHKSGCVEPESVVRNAANAEAQKTIQLLAGLHATTDDMEKRLGAFQDSINVLEHKAKSVRKKIEELEGKIIPSETHLISLFNKRQKLQDKLSLYERLDAYENMMRDVTGGSQQEESSQPKRLNYVVAKDLSELIERQLNLWGYQTNERIRYDRYKYDLFIGEKPLRAHSERERVVLHAAFAIALAQYCHRNQTPHLGFVVLDLPNIPDSGEESQKKCEAPTFAYCDQVFFPNLDYYDTGQLILIMKEETTFPYGVWRPDMTKYINLRKGGFPHSDWPPNSPGWNNNNKVGE